MEIQVESNRVFVEDANGNIMAEITFPSVSDTRVNFDHTFISPSFPGKSMLATLMRAAVAQIQAQNLQATATCPMAINWFEEHPEFVRALDIC